MGLYGRRSLNSRPAVPKLVLPDVNYYRDLFAVQEPTNEQRHFNSNSMNSSRVVPVLRTARVTPGFCQ